MLTQLEKDFHDAMVQIYHRAKVEANYIATRYNQMVSEHGGVEAAKILINTEKPSDGFTELWNRGRLDITVESLVQNPKWKPLFYSYEIELAKQKLKNYGYELD